MTRAEEEAKAQIWRQEDKAVRAALAEAMHMACYDCGVFGAAHDAEEFLRSLSEAGYEVRKVK